MSHRLRLQPIVDRVTNAGIAGNSMQDELRKCAAAEDLTSHQICRIAEAANRAVQLHYQKTASDKRFKFELCNPFELTAELRKTAGWQGGNGGAEKTASGLDLSDFYSGAPAEKSASPLSLFDVNADPALVKQKLENRTRELIAVYNKTAAELETMLTATKAAEVETRGLAVQVFERMIADAVEMVMTGVTLPSLWQAVTGAVEGSMASNHDRAASERVMRLIIDGLKERRVPNIRLGFRWKGDPDHLNELDTDDLIALCKRSTGYPQDFGTTMQTAKSASRFIEVRADMRGFKGQPFEEAGRHLDERIDLLSIGVPQIYLDDALTNNLPAGGARMVNGDSEFIIAVRDIIGMQDRLLKNHNAQEYLGLKLKEISDTVRGLVDAQSKTSEALAAEIAEAEALKTSFLAPIAAAAGRALASPITQGVAAVVPAGIAVAQSVGAKKGPKPAETPAPAGAVT